jgi:hypothetical protein
MTHQKFSSLCVRVAPSATIPEVFERPLLSGPNAEIVQFSNQSGRKTPTLNQQLTMLKPNKLFITLAASVVLFAMTIPARAQLIYSEDFSKDDSTNWVVNYSHTGSNYANFNFDYTAVGLPPAPHSTGGNTKGLKLSPDITAGSLLVGAVPGVSVTPTNFSITENFDMHADMWINYNNGGGSTIIYGCGYGTAGTSAQVAGSADSIYVGACTDTGSASSAVRMYGPSQAGSYQNGVYQSTGTAIPSFPGEPFVYNNPTGTRAFYTASTWASVAHPNWLDFFPSVKVPDAQTNLYPEQTGATSAAGSPTFGWHDVEVQKIGNVIVYLIDGHIVATGNYSSAGTPAGDKLVFLGFDINSSVSADPNFANLNFVVFANIVVSNFPTVVNVTTSVPTCTEGSPDAPGMFTLTRSSSAGSLAVSYTLTGTATNGVQYQTIPLTVTFADGETTTNVYVVPIDDGVPRPTTSVALNLQPGPGYGAAGSAVVNILDNDTPTIDISGGSQAYGRYTNTVAGAGNNDFVLYTLTRRGKLTTGSDLTVNLSYSGSAVSGMDFTPVGSVVIADGSSSNAVFVSPVDDPAVTTNRTLTISVAAGSGYAIGAGPVNGTIVSAHYNPAPVLLTDALTNVDDGTNWSLVYGSGDTMLNTNNFSADFGMDLNTAAGGIPIPPPPGGQTHALHLTCNKALNPGAPGAINAYYTNALLSGNYAVRFNMNLIQGQVNQTEGAVFGLNCTGSSSNWWYGSGYLTNGGKWSSDGIWYFMISQPAGASAGDYQEFTGAGGTNGNTGWQKLASKFQSSFTTVFKDNPGPFTCSDGFGGQSPGVPANNTPALGYDASTWCDVEMKQQDGIVTLSINHTPIFVYTNKTVWKGGYLMLGYADPFGSVGSPDAGVYYANLQVVQLPSEVINSIAITGGNVVVTFTTTGTGDTPASFTLTTSAAAAGPYVGVASTIIPLGNNQFRATTPYVGGAQRFYHIMHN